MIRHFALSAAFKMQEEEKIRIAEGATAAARASTRQNSSTRKHAPKQHRRTSKLAIAETFYIFAPPAAH